MFYECVVIARQDISTAHVEQLSEKFSEIIVKNSGKVTKTEYCGLRALAYPIKKNRKGHYIVFNIDAPSHAVEEFGRLLKINEDILRFLITRVERLNEEPSALLKQSRTFEPSQRGGYAPRGGRGYQGDSPRSPSSERYSDAQPSQKL